MRNSRGTKDVWVARWAVFHSARAASRSDERHGLNKWRNDIDLMRRARATASRGPAGDPTNAAAVSKRAGAHGRARKLHFEELARQSNFDDKQAAQRTSIPLASGRNTRPVGLSQPDETRLVDLVVLAVVQYLFGMK